jgi:hypothetical protein
MNLMTIHAAHMVGGVGPVQPVPDFFVATVAAETNAVGGPNRALRETEDLGNVTAPLDVKTSVAVAVLAFQSLLLVEGMLKILEVLLMAERARIASHFGGAGNLDVARISFRAGGGPLVVRSRRPTTHSYRQHG